MANTISARGLREVTITDPVNTSFRASDRGVVEAVLIDPSPEDILGPSDRGTVDVTIVSPTSANKTESARGTVGVTINKRIAILFWTVVDGERVPLLAFKPVPPPPTDPENPENPLRLGDSARGTLSLRIGPEPVETREYQYWPYAAVGPANSPRGSGVETAPLNDERTRALRGGVTVSCAGVNRTLNTSMRMNVGQWSVGVNIADENDPWWTLTGDGVAETHTVRIPNPPIRSGETGNGDYLTELIQPDGTSLSVYKFGYGLLDLTNRRARVRSGAWNRLNQRTSSGVSDDPNDPQYKRGPRASQAPAQFGLIREWEAEKAIAGDWQNAIRHTMAVAFQGHAFKRGSKNNGISQVWPAFGSDYHGDRATQVLDPPGVGNFTLSSTVNGVTRATTQAWNVGVSTLQSAIRSWGGDYSSVSVTGTAGSSYSISSVRSNANTFKVTGGSITAPGTVYADVGMPVGQYFVVDPTINVGTLPLVHPVSKAIGVGFQDFGGYALDMSSTSVVYAEVGAADLLGPHQTQIGKDLDILRQYFLAVTNNSPTNIHGGGTPVRDSAPPFSV